MSRQLWPDSLKVEIDKKCKEMTDKQLAIHLSQLAGYEIKIENVRKQRQRLGLKKVRGRGVIRLEAADGSV